MREKFGHLVHEKWDYEGRYMNYGMITLINECNKYIFGNIFESKKEIITRLNGI